MSPEGLEGVEQERPSERIPDPVARDKIDSPRVTDRVYGRYNLTLSLTAIGVFVAE